MVGIIPTIINELPMIWPHDNTPTVILLYTHNQTKNQLHKGLIYVTGFAKIRNNPERTDIPKMAWHECHTPALSRHSNERATHSQVCFHWRHFCDIVSSI